MAGYSNLHTQKKAWQQEFRRVTGEMAKVDATHGKHKRHRAEMEALAAELRAQLHEVVTELTDATKRHDFKREQVLKQEAEQIAQQVTEAESEAESAQQDADKSRAAYEDWQAHMPAQWRLVPVLCPGCLGDQVDPAPNEVMGGTCSECDADVNLPAGTIRHEGRSYAPWRTVLYNNAAERSS